MTCVKRVSYALLINNQPSKLITPSRGLHQGDPIFPYLYLICAKGLSTLLNKAETYSKIWEIKVSRSSPTINHLFFVDDNIIFCRATSNEWLDIQKVLKTYEKTVGQGINRQKSRVLFSSNTSVAAKTSILSISGVSACYNSKKYLRLPLMVGWNRCRIFETIKDWVWSHIRNWKNSFLTQARKEVLLKVVIQAIPTNTISMFTLSRKICKDVVSSMSKFWLSSSNKASGVHWKN